MQNLIIKIRCVSRKQLFFSCCLVCISMTPECWGLYAFENKDCIPSAGADGRCTLSQVYRLPARTVTSHSDGIPQSGAYGSLRKVGIPSSGVQRVNGRSKVRNLCLFTLARSQLTLRRQLRDWRRRLRGGSAADGGFKQHVADVKHIVGDDQANLKIEIPQFDYVSQIATNAAAVASRLTEIIQTARCWRRKHRWRRPDDDQDRSKFRNYKNLCLRD